MTNPLCVQYPRFCFCSVFYADVPSAQDPRVLGRVGMAPVAVWVFRLALMNLAEADYLFSEVDNCLKSVQQVTEIGCPLVCVFF